MRLFGLEPLHSPDCCQHKWAPNIPCMYFEYWGVHCGNLWHIQAVFQNTKVTILLSSCFLQFSNPTYSMSNVSPQFGNCSYGFQFHARSLVHDCREGDPACQWLTDSSVAYAANSLSLLTITVYSALCLIMFPCYQFSQSEQFVIYVCHHLFLKLCGDRCHWLCYKSFTSFSVLCFALDGCHSKHHRLTL